MFETGGIQTAWTLGTQASAVTTRWAGTVCCGHPSGWWCHSVEACGVRGISRSQPALGLSVHSLHWASVSTACTGARCPQPALLWLPHSTTYYNRKQCSRSPIDGWEDYLAVYESTIHYIATGKRHRLSVSGDAFYLSDDTPMRHGSVCWDLATFSSYSHVLIVTIQREPKLSLYEQQTLPLEPANCTFQIPHERIPQYSDTTHHGVLGCLEC